MASNITVDTLTKGGVTLNTDEIVDTNSTQVCKAWVNFDSAGGVSIRSSFNISSVTDVSTGKYTVNFTSAMPNNEYSIALGNKEINRYINGNDVTPTTTSFGLASQYPANNGYYTASFISAIVFSE